MVSRESSYLEFKESFNWGHKEKYAKTIASFANSKGGYIIFGIQDTPKELIGLTNNNFENRDEADISGYLNLVFSPEIMFEKFTIQVRGKNMGIIYVYESVEKPVLSIKQDGLIKEADIYYRYSGRSERIKYPELQHILDAIKEKEKNNWMQHFENIAKIGSSKASVMDTINGTINGKGGTLVIDKKLVPKLKFITEGNLKHKGWPTLKLIGDVKPVSVTTQGFIDIKTDALSMRLTDNPQAPVVQLKEKDMLKEYPLTSRDVIEILRNRYDNFKSNPAYYNLRNLFKKDKTLWIRRYLNPSNEKSTHTDFYRKKIIIKFDKYYKKKK